MSKSARYMRMALLRDTAQKTRNDGGDINKFKKYFEVSLRNRMGRKFTNRALRDGLALIDKHWKEQNCTVCILLKRLLDPPADCPECKGKGFHLRPDEVAR